MDQRARVRACLERAGLTGLPADADADAPLAPHGLDSLLAVLVVIELQKEFACTIPASRLTDGAFDTLASISALVEDLP